jgi:serine/threonine protein kinase
MNRFREQSCNLKMSSGSQGYVKYIQYNKHQAVKKWSKTVDYTIELEALVLKRIKSLKSPNYAEFLKLKPHPRSSRLITKRVLGTSLNDAIHVGLVKSLSNASCLLANAAYITLCAAKLLTDTMGIVHNDLHTSNVLLTKTDCDAFAYKFNDDTIFAFKTFGICPVIIDFGYAYVAGEKMLAPANFTHIGYSVHNFDALADARILLWKMADKFQKYSGKSDRVAKQFIKTTRRLFGPLNLKNGWFRDYTFTDITEELIELTMAKPRAYSNAFDVNEEIDEIINIFLAQLSFEECTDCPLKDETVFCDAFHELAQNLSTYNLFYRVGLVKQLELVKNLYALPLNVLVKKYDENIVAHVENAKKTIEAMKIHVHKFLSMVDDEKEKAYDKLSVRDTLQVLKAMPIEPIVYEKGMKIKLFDCTKYPENIVRDVVLLDNVPPVW